MTPRPPDDTRDRPGARDRHGARDRLGTRTRIAVVGASGFIGSHVLACGRAQDLDIHAVPGPKVRVDDWKSSPAAARSWWGGHAEEVERFARSLQGFDVVVNAAGMGAPTSADEQALYSANAVQPLVLARACRVADVRRLVHVSTAAVQGRLDPLDETLRRSPFSPYTRSKAEGERGLLDSGGDAPPEIVVYRPTSVQGVERAITRRLARLAHAPVVPISGTGDQPLPIALVDNVAHGIVFAAAMAYSALSPFNPIVIQPSEDITTRQLFEFLSARRLVSLPPRPVGWALAGIRLPSRYLPSLSTSVRGLELLYQGQHVVESALTRSGFVPPVGPEGWKELGAAMWAARPRASARPGAISSPRA